MCARIPVGSCTGNLCSPSIASIAPAVCAVFPRAHLRRCLWSRPDISKNTLFEIGGCGWALVRVCLPRVRVVRMRRLSCVLGVGALQHSGRVPPPMRQQDGDTALDFATRNGHAEMKALLTGSDAEVRAKARAHLAPQREAATTAKRRADDEAAAKRRADEEAAATAKRRADEEAAAAAKRRADEEAAAAAAAKRRANAATLCADAFAAFPAACKPDTTEMLLSETGVGAVATLHACVALRQRCVNARNTTGHCGDGGSASDATGDKVSVLAVGVFVYAVRTVISAPMCASLVQVCLGGSVPSGDFNSTTMLQLIPQLNTTHIDCISLHTAFHAAAERMARHDRHSVVRRCLGGWSVFGARSCRASNARADLAF
jgi:hypothetical protein